MSDPNTIEEEFQEAIGAALDLATLESVRVAALGKKGRIAALMKGLAVMDGEDRKRFGAEVNAVKARLADAFAARKAVLEDAALDARLVAERLDVSLPAPPSASGRVHPVSQVMDEIAELFGDLGFRVAEGPEIEDDWRNFEALNIPESHPARQMMDTFYLPRRDDGANMVLRTHTSPVQIRTMMSEPPPIRIIAPGRVYRSDYDQTHTPMFHQVEGLAIDRDLHMGHLKWCLEEFARAFFEVAQVEMRFRPSYFPFTEPSAEVDIRCDRSGKDLKIGEGDDWLEILGCGMVHPKVIANCGLDPEEWRGFAFGMGIDRIAMLKYGIPDLRAFFDSDLRWLRHYGFSALDAPSLGGGLSR